MSTLTVALPLADPDTALEMAYVLSLDGRTITQHGFAPMALLPKADATILVVPVQKISYHALTLPQAPKARLRAALEGLLEDRLLEAPETQALALAPDAQARHNSWVASCDKAWLQAQLQSFEQAGHHTHRIVPQVWPQADRYLMATGSPADPWLVRADTDGVLACPLNSAAFLCVGLPDGEAVQSPPELSQTIEHVLARPVRLISGAQALLACQASPWDLAQFDIRLNQQSPWLRKLTDAWKTLAHNPFWRAARWGLGVLLLAQLVGLTGLAWQENRSLAQKKTLQTQLFLQAFPQVKVVLDPMVQMQRELGLLRAASPVANAHDLEAQLGAFADAAMSPNTAGDLTPPQSLQYSSGVLTLKGLRLSPQAVPSLVERLQAQAYQVNWQDGTLTLKVQP